MGFPGLVLALLASRLRELDRRPHRDRRNAAQMVAARHARRDALRHALAICAGIGAAWRDSSPYSRGSLAIRHGAVRHRHERRDRLDRVAARAARRATNDRSRRRRRGAFDDFQDARSRAAEPTLIWVFLGGAMVTFAVNGLIAWAAAFMERMHGLSVARVADSLGCGRSPVGAGGARRGAHGGSVAAALARRTRAHVGRGVRAGRAGVRRTAPGARSPLVRSLILATYFLYTWYNGPLAAVILDVVPPAVSIGAGCVRAVLAPGR